MRRSAVVGVVILAVVAFVAFRFLTGLNGPPSGAVPAIFTDDTGEQPVVEDDLDLDRGVAA